MTILIDIDDTCTNMSDVMLRRLNAKYGTSYKKSNITSWTWYRDTFKSPWEVTDDKSFWDEVRVLDSAKQVIEELVKQGNQIYLVTASFFNDTLGYKIQSTISQFDPMLINKNNVIVCYNKQAINGDVRIDDGLHNFSKNSVNLLYNQPWNQSSDFGNMITRVNDWNEIRYIIAQWQ